MKKLYLGICKLEEIICGISIVAIVALVFVSAVSRSVKMPIQGIIDIAQLLFAWVAFLGADVALRENKMVGVDILTKKLPFKTQKILELVMNCIMVVLLVALLFLGLKLSIDSYERTFQTLSISYSLVTLSLPVGAFLMCTTLLIRMTDTVKAIFTGEQNK